MGEGYKGYKRVIIVGSKYVNPALYHWVLLDLAGNIEQECVMTAYEAKLENEKLTDRLIRWVPKDRTPKEVYLESPLTPTHYF